MTDIYFRNDHILLENVKIYNKEPITICPAALSSTFGFPLRIRALKGDIGKNIQDHYFSSGIFKFGVGAGPTTIGANPTIIVAICDTLRSSSKDWSDAAWKGHWDNYELDREFTVLGVPGKEHFTLDFIGWVLDKITNLV